jgi:hypothetical protein
VSESVVESTWTDSAHRFMQSTTIAAAVAALVVLPVALMAIDQLPVGVVHDDGMYTILAKSLATGHGYRWINLPGEPRATHFPPGYPAFLALLWRIGPAFPGNIVFFKLVNALLLGVAAALVAVFVRKRLGLSSPAACLTAIFGCAGIPVLVLTNLVMSETLFFTLLIGCLIYAERCLEREQTTPLEATLLAVAGGVLMLVRTHGVAFVGAVALLLLLRRRFRALGVFLVVSAIVAYPWHHWQSVHSGVVPVPMRGDYESYGNWFFGGSPAHSIAFLGRTIAATSREIFAMLVVLTTSGMPTRGVRLLGVGVAIALLVLGLVALRRRAPVTVAFMAGFFAIVLVWPFSPARFVWAVWPLLVVLFVAGALAVKDWRPAARPANLISAVVAAGAIITILGYVTYNLNGYRGRWWSSIGRAAVQAAGPSVTWVARNTPPNAVISSNSEVMIYLYTGRISVPATQFRPEDYFARPSVESRIDALRSILQAYRIDAVAIVANDSLEAAARRMAGGPAPVLRLREEVPAGLILSPTFTTR